MKILLRDKQVNVINPEDMPHVCAKCGEKADYYTGHVIAQNKLGDLVIPVWSEDGKWLCVSHWLEHTDHERSGCGVAARPAPLDCDQVKTASAPDHTVAQD